MPATASPPMTSLPQVVLKDRLVPLAILQLIPLETAEKFQVVAYEADDSHVYLALVHPEQLKHGFYVALEEVGKKIHKEIKLFRTDPASLQSVLKQYRAGVGKIKSPVNVPKPPLFELGKTVAVNYLRRIPLAFARKYRLISVDFLAPHTYWFLTDGSKDDLMPGIVQFIEEKNNIKVHLLHVKPGELDGLLKYYESVEKAELTVHAKPAKAERPAVEKVAPRPAVEKPVTPAPITPVISAQAVYIHVPEGDKVHTDAPLPASLPTPASPPSITLEEAKPVAAKQEEKKVEKEDGEAVVRSVQPIKDAPVSSPEPTKEEAPVKPAPVPAAVSASSDTLATPSEKEMVVPDVHGKVLSSEEEKGGIAGLFQKVAQSLGATSEKEEQPTEKGPTITAPQVPEAKPAATTTGNTHVPVPAPAPAAKPAASGGASVASVQRPTGASEEDGDIGKLLEKQVESLDELKKHVQGGFIPRIVAAIVSYAIHEKASDIHIESFDDEVRIRFRIDGQLLDIIKLPPDLQAAVVSRIKILSRLRLDETRIPQDGRFDVAFNNAQVDLRVSVMPTVHGEKVVMRILDKSRGVTSLEKLGIEGRAYMNLTKAIQKPFGICLATGPTGSGKSTSLYAILNRIATPNVNVVTLEDPVEYEMKGINQSQIRPKIGYTFAEGLRSILRQDPNIIMVGEIRDGETANMATQAALTGHLVLSTLHTNDAAGAIPRLTNMGIEPFLITSSLNVAMGQRLVRKICPFCKQEVNMPQGLRDKFKKELDLIGQVSPEDADRAKGELKFFQGVGCAKCGGKGYQGRMGIYEVLIMSDAVEELTMNRASNVEIQNQAQKEGMLTMYQDGLLKIVAGVTTLDEVLRETSTK